MNEKITVTTTVGELKAAALFASKDPCRYIMCGVYIEVRKNGATTITSTDGRRIVSIRLLDLAVSSDTAASDVSCSIIVPATLITALNGAPSETCRITFCRLVDPANPRLIAIGISPACRPTIMHYLHEVVASYPSYRGCIPVPAESPDRGIAVNPRLLADFAKALLMLGGAKGAMMILSIPVGSTGSLVIRDSVTDCRFFGLLMPLRGGEDMEYGMCHPAPDWIND